MNAAKTYALFFSLTVLAACGGEKQEEATNESVSTDTLTHTDAVSIDTLTERPIELHIDPKLGFSERIDAFIEAYQVNYEEGSSDKRSVLQRFENTGVRQLSLKKKFAVKYGDNEVYPEAHFSFYTYRDSAQCANAISNWLACFGNDCNEIRPGEDMQIKSTPGFYILNEDNILTLDYPLEHAENNWEDMKKDLQSVFQSKKSLYTIDVQPHGKLKWILVKK